MYCISNPLCILVSMMPDELCEVWGRQTNLVTAAHSVTTAGMLAEP